MPGRHLPRASRMAMALLLALSTAACDLDSLTGPEGPQGPEGPAGPAGPPGAQGQGGGTSLISRTLTINNASYVPGYSTVLTSTGQAQRPARVVTVTDARITQQVIEAGAILMFMQVPEQILSTNVQWAPLPYRNYMVLGRYYWNWTYDIRPGQLRILFFIDALADSTPPALNSVTIPTQTFRMVIIPPG